jgi:sugar phosphate isomerase/epimerase
MTTGTRPRAGTFIRATAGAVESIRRLLPHGFECWQIGFSLKRDVIPPLAPLADEVRAVIEGTGTVVSALGIYGNPLRDDAVGAETRRALHEAFTTVSRFGTNVIGCFAGRVTGASVEASLPRFREVWSELAKEAEDNGVRIAFENCLQGGTWENGDWNMAHNPDAWERMFEAVPNECLGLEWEPAHQLCQLIDPLPQLKKWAPRIFHLHGKDANVHRDIIAQHGIFGRERVTWHRFPGLGDTDWTEILRPLQSAGFSGSIDIEGYHDPVFNGDREIEGQVNALHYLQECRRKASPAAV